MTERPPIERVLQQEDGTILGEMGTLVYSLCRYALSLEFELREAAKRELLASESALIDSPHLSVAPDEYYLWRMVAYGFRADPRGVSPCSQIRDRLELAKQQSEKAGGWWIGREGVNVFVPLPEWLEMYASWKSRK